MKINALREISLATHSLDETAPGLAAITGHPGYEVQEDGEPPIQSRFRSFAVGDRSIALMESVGGESPITRYLSRRGPGIFSMTFGVADLDEATSHLRAAGARVTMEQAIVARGRSGSQRFAKIRLNFVAPTGPTHGLVCELQELHGPEDALLKDAPRGPDVPFAINEVHCAVNDVDAAATDLSRLFGFEVGPEVVQAQAPEEVRYRNLYIGDRPVLALIAPATPTSSIHKFLARRGEGIFSLSMRVGDAGAYADRVAAAGIDMLFDEPKTVSGGRIGATIIKQSKIMWVKPQPLSNRVLFEIQEYEA